MDVSKFQSQRKQRCPSQQWLMSENWWRCNWMINSSVALDPTSRHGCDGWCLGICSQFGFCLFSQFSCRSILSLPSSWWPPIASRPEIPLWFIPCHGYVVYMKCLCDVCQWTRNMSLLEWYFICNYGSLFQHIDATRILPVAEIHFYLSIK